MFVGFGVDVAVGLGLGVAVGIGVLVACEVGADIDRAVSVGLGVGVAFVGVGADVFVARGVLVGFSAGEELFDASVSLTVVSSASVSFVFGVSAIISV